MTEYISLANIFIEIWGGTFCLIGIASSLIVPFVDDRSRRFSVAMFAFCALAMFADAAAGVGNGKTDALSVVLTHCGNLLNFCALPALAGVYCSYITLQSAESTKFRRSWLRIAPMISACIIAGVIANLFIGNVYYIDSANVYHRGEHAIIFQAMPLIMVLISILVLIRSRKSISTRKMITLIASSAFPFAGGVMIMISYGIAWIHITMTLSALLLFLEMQFEGTESYVKAQTDLADSKSLLMLSQIRPHFIYNSLNAIQYLCRTDPTAASKAIGTFGTYLRGNIDSLESEGETMVPFKKEINFVKAYLDLEKLRFGEKLTIEWDIESDDFMIPPLTVQVLAENAVKHGIRESGKSGCVTISSWEEHDAYVVQVEDDGMGFDVNATRKDDGRAHIGVSSARKRIESLAQGTMEIQSEVGKGTVVIIAIPKYNHLSDNKK